MLCAVSFYEEFWYEIDTKNDVSEEEKLFPQESSKKILVQLINVIFLEVIF
jgi:choline kinase